MLDEKHNSFESLRDYPQIPLKSKYFRSENFIFCLFHTFLGLFGLLYGLFGPFLTLFNTETSFLVLLGNFSMEKLSGLSVKRAGGIYLPFPLRFFLAKSFSAKGGGWATPLAKKNPPSSF